MAKKPIDVPKNPPEEAAEQPPEAPRARQTNQPTCPYHPNTQCKSRHSDAFFTRYYCPEPGCTFSVKVARPDIQKRVQQSEEDEGFSAR